jgi:hypothetical protein
MDPKLPELDTTELDLSRLTASQIQNVSAYFNLCVLCASTVSCETLNGLFSLCFVEEARISR